MSIRELDLTRNDASIRQAALAAVRQELSAPVAAILGYAEMLLEDAARPDLAEFAEDLRRIHAAGTQLGRFVDRLLAADDAQWAEMSEEAFHGLIRHDLRTPINAVKGYAELMLETAQERRLDGFAADLNRLMAASDALLTRIEEVAALDTAAPDGGPRAGLEILKQSVLPEVVSAVAPLVEAAPGTMPPGRILIADDNEANRELLRRRLERDGHQIITVENGVRALAVACAQELDLILLDVMMPRLGGYEVLTRLRASERTARIPVIMISALTEMNSIVRCIEAGAEDYLSKPWSPVILKARVRACLEKKHLRDRDRSRAAAIEAAHRKAEALLLNILPQSVVRRLYAGEAAIADRCEDATVLFADIVGFTALSMHLPAARVVEMLNAVFSAFDKAAQDSGVEKIKTVGDAYMAVAGVLEQCDDHPARIARLALAIMRATEAVGHELGEPVALRVGIHTGPVVAGIIGTRKFAYDVWGDAVNVASRMEAQGVPGEIQASHATYSRLKQDFIWVPRGEIALKGRGPMPAYLLKGPAAA